MDKMFQKAALNLARVAIKEELLGHKELTSGVLERLEGMFGTFSEQKAAFVTLTIDGALRGCIGSIVPHRRLDEDIIANAKAAAYSDPRFQPLDANEFSKISIEVSLLSIPEPLEYQDAADLRNKIRPGIDGVILKLDGRQATYLPQVWEEVRDFETFFSTLCMKAGLGGNCLAYHPEIFVYQVEKFSEKTGF